jgi:hypothetical protein
MVVKHFDSNYVSGDWLLREGDDHEYTRNSFLLLPTSIGGGLGYDVMVPSGTCIDNTNGVVVGAPGNIITGIILRDTWLPAASLGVKTAVLRPGSHSIINADALPLHTLTGDPDIVVTDLITDLQASGYFVRREPIQQTTQGRMETLGAEGEGNGQAPPPVDKVPPVVPPKEEVPPVDETPPPAEETEVEPPIAGEVEPPAGGVDNTLPPSEEVAPPAGEIDNTLPPVDETVPPPEGQVDNTLPPTDIEDAVVGQPIELPPGFKLDLPPGVKLPTAKPGQPIVIPPHTKITIPPDLEFPEGLGLAPGQHPVLPPGTTIKLPGNAKPSQGQKPTLPVGTELTLPATKPKPKKK